MKISDFWLYILIYWQCIVCDNVQGHNINNTDDDNDANIYLFCFYFADYPQLHNRETQ